MRARALAALAAPPLAAVLGFAWFLARAGAEPEWPLRPADGIAALTGGAGRVEAGLRLLDAGTGPLLVSGAHPDATLAGLARLAGRDAADLAGRVTLGRRATTTLGNAAEVATWARTEGLGSVRVVTAGYHMPRALLELGRALPGVALVPHPVQPEALRGGEALARPRTWRLLVGEYAKYLGALAGLARLTEPAPRPPPEGDPPPPAPAPGAAPSPG